jgi:hypothetical protein
VNFLPRIDFDGIQAITQGRFGRTMAVCPLCSSTRRTPQKRASKVLAVNLLAPDFAVYFCNHCGESGYSHPDKCVVDRTEQKCRQATQHAETERQKRQEQALRLWHAGRPFRGSPAEDYLLHTRGIGDWLDTFPFLDQVFCYHPDCPFADERHPCLIALVRDIHTDIPVAIHRTALTKDDPPQKIGRMSLGPISGGAIKISPDFEVHEGLMIGEGIETVLSASQHYQFKPVWSLIDAANLARFPPLSGIECLTIAVDNDANGTGQFAATECSARYLRASIEVTTVKPTRVKDFNDLVVSNA